MGLVPIWVSLVDHNFIASQVLIYLTQTHFHIWVSGVDQRALWTRCPSVRKVTNAYKMACHFITYCIHGNHTNTVKWKLTTSGLAWSIGRVHTTRSDPAQGTSWSTPVGGSKSEDLDPVRVCLIRIPIRDFQRIKISCVQSNEKQPRESIGNGQRRYCSSVHWIHKVKLTDVSLMHSWISCYRHDPITWCFAERSDPWCDCGTQN